MTASWSPPEPEHRTDVNPVKIPGLGDIPIIGPIFFDSTIFLYITYVMIILVQVGLFSTGGACRCAPSASIRPSRPVGIRVLATRYRNVILGGLIAGIGGASLTVGSVGTFTKDMSSGLGYIALAAMIFGRWTPLGATAAALLFGFTNSLQATLSTINVPVSSFLLLMAPYVATIIAVAGLVGRVNARRRRKALREARRDAPAAGRPTRRPRRAPTPRPRPARPARRADRRRPGTTSPWFSDRLGARGDAPGRPDASLRWPTRRLSAPRSAAILRDPFGAASAACGSWSSSAGSTCMKALPVDAVVHGVRTAIAAGCRVVVLTNAAAASARDSRSGSRCSSATTLT